MGNLGSIRNMLHHIGKQSVISGNASEIRQADKLILSGVGAFDHGMQRIRDSGLLSVLTDRATADKVPILGICLGMQLFTRSSEEGSLAGLGWLSASTVRFRPDPAGPVPLKIPHMGWNLVHVEKDSRLFRGMNEPPRFYFVHSYHVVCEEKGDVVGTTQYGTDFVSAVEKENLFGVQFHPEKSHKFGMKLLENFAEIR